MNRYLLQTHTFKIAFPTMEEVSQYISNREYYFKHADYTVYDLGGYGG